MDLRMADALTSKMTLEVYREFAWARKAGFTSRPRQALAFRSWLGPGTSRGHSDAVIEALGYFGWEAVGMLVLVALRVQHDEAVAQ